jgi:hypothetical protein
MRVYLIGKDGGKVICGIRSDNYDKYKKIHPELKEITNSN